MIVFPQGIVLYLDQEIQNARAKHSLLIKKLVISSPEDLVANLDSTYYLCDLGHVT